MPHTDCAMAGGDEADIHNLIQEKFGVDTTSLMFRTTRDQRAALAADVQDIRQNSLLPAGVSVAGALYDVKTGTILPVDC
jgi:carbonic anhydrase